MSCNVNLCVCVLECFCVCPLHVTSYWRGMKTYNQKDSLNQNIYLGTLNMFIYSGIFYVKSIFKAEANKV